MQATTYTADSPTTPMSRRDVWLTIALAVAKDGLSTPTEQKANTTNDGQPMLMIEVETEADAKAWAAHLGIEIKPYHVRDTGISTWGEFSGWRTNIHWMAPEPSPLAEQVIAAIETPAVAGQLHWLCDMDDRCTTHIVGPNDAETQQMIDEHVQEHIDAESTICNAPHPEHSGIHCREPLSRHDSGFHIYSGDDGAYAWPTDDDLQPDEPTSTVEGYAIGTRGKA